MTETIYKQVCWTTGNLAQRKDLINIVKASVAKSDPDYELSEFNDDFSIEFVVNQINTFSCLGQKRLIILNDWPEAKSNHTASINALAKVLCNLPDDCVVVLNNLETESKKFQEAMKKVAKEYHYNQMVEFNEATGWVVDEFRKQDKIIDSENAYLLVKSISVERNYKTMVDLDKLFLLFKKLNDYVGSRKKITEEDVFLIAIDFTEFIVWSLYNYLDKKDLDNSMLLSNKLLNNNSKIEHTIAMTLNSMIWRYRMLLCIKEGVSQNLGEQQIIEDMNKMIKIDKEEEKKPIYSANAIRGALKGFYGSKPPILCYTKKELHYILKSVNDVLLKIRSGATEQEAKNLFELILAVICNVFKPENLAIVLREYKFNLLRS